LFARALSNALRDFTGIVVEVRKYLCILNRIARKPVSVPLAGRETDFPAERMTTVVLRTNAASQSRAEAPRLSGSLKL
jgi:hypothetical protein